MSRPAGFEAGRLAIAGLIACAYIGASALLVRSQGEGYRAQLRERRTALAKAIPPPIVAVDAALPDVARKAETAPAPVAAPAPSPVAAPAPPAVASAAVPEERRPVPAPVIARAPEPPKAKSVPALDPFWELPEQKVVWDVDHLTIDDERRLGAALHKMVLHTHKPVEEGPLPRRVDEVGQPLTKSLAKSGLSYTFTVLDCDEANAFSHPGGYVYVCKGIFDWIAEDEDYALAFLLAHEIAHVDLGHALAILRDPGVRDLQASTVAKCYWPILPCGYMEEQDLEADRWAWRRMSQAGSTRREVLAFLRKLDDFARKNGFDVRRKLPMDDPKIAPLDHHLRSHPVPRARLKSLLEAMDPPRKPG